MIHTDNGDIPRKVRILVFTCIRIDIAPNITALGGIALWFVSNK